jgi:hypothetical protein
MIWKWLRARWLWLKWFSLCAMMLTIASSLAGQNTTTTGSMVMQNGQDFFSPKDSKLMCFPGKDESVTMMCSTGYDGHDPICEAVPKSSPKLAACPKPFIGQQTSISYTTYGPTYVCIPNDAHKFINTFPFPCGATAKELKKKQSESRTINTLKVCRITWTGQQECRMADIITCSISEEIVTCTNKSVSTASSAVPITDNPLIIGMSTTSTSGTVPMPLPTIIEIQDKSVTVTKKVCPSGYQQVTLIVPDKLNRSGTANLSPVFFDVSYAVCAENSFLKKLEVDNKK